MDSRMFVRKNASVLAFVLTLTACGLSGEKYCDDLERRFSDPELQGYLIDWVDANVVGHTFSDDETSMGGGMVPGWHWLPYAVVDWDRLDFREQSQVRLVASSGPSAREAESIYFGERSRRGVLVRMPDSLAFGVKESELRPISDRVAIYCMQD